MKIRIAIDLSAGRVVRYFILVDLILLAGWGAIDPLFSVFVVNHIPGATLATAGALAAFYWTLRSFLPLPFAKLLDRQPGEKDDFYMLIVGLFVISFSALAFAVSQAVWQLYVIQAVKAVGFSLYAASWPAIFSRHLDKDRVAFDWAIDSTAVGVGSAVGGFMGGLIGQYLGFSAIFFYGGTVSFFSAVVLLFVPSIILPPAPPQAPPHEADVRMPAGAPHR